MAEATVPVVPAPVEEKHPDGAPILKGRDGTSFWPTEAKAIEVAKGRVKGARRAFIVKNGDKTRYATASHEHFLMACILENELKYVVTEVGKPERASTPVTANGVQAALDALPEAEREAVKKQLLALLSGKK